MYQLDETTAIRLVRRNLEELNENDSAMYSDDGDNSAMDNIIKENLPDAINAIHGAAPANRLEGIDGLDSIDNIKLGEDTEHTPVTFTLKDEDYFRMVAILAKDSVVVVTDVLTEASPEGRKQQNKYIRGRYDRPRIVRSQNNDTTTEEDKSYPVFTYYSIKENPSSANKPQMDAAETGEPTTETLSAGEIFSSFIFIKEASAQESGEYDISRQLKQNIIDYLTGLVMTAYGDTRSEIYYTRATNF